MQEADSVYKWCVLCLNVNKIGGSYDRIKATQAISLGIVCLHCTLTTTQMATNSWYFILSLISRLYYGDTYGYECLLLSYVYFCDCRRIHTHTLPTLQQYYDNSVLVNTTPITTEIIYLQKLDVHSRPSTDTLSSQHLNQNKLLPD